MKRLLLKFVFAFVFAFLILNSKLSTVSAATRTWDGGGGADTNWSTCANWDGPDICPVAGDTVTFNGTSTNNSTIDSGFGGSIGVINLNSGYTGTVTQAETLAVTSTMTVSAGTYNAGSQTLTVTSTTTVSGGILNLNSSSATLAALTFSSGTLTMSSGTTNISGALTFSGAGTFSANGGTVNFNGTTAANITCNNVLFNFVTFTHTGGNAKNPQAGCTLPLGANPTITGIIGMQGATLTGSGTITFGNNVNFSSGSTPLSGFSGIVTSGAFTISGATVDLGTYTTVDVNGTFTLSSGSFTAPSGTMTAALTFTISGTPTFNANGGTITFDGGGATLSCNNVTFNLVTFNHINTKTVSSNCSLPLGVNPTLLGGGSVTLNGTMSGTGVINTGSGTFTLGASTGTLSGFSGINNTAGTFIVNGTLDASGYNPVNFFTFTENNGGTFTAPSGTMNIAGNINFNGGTFNTNNGSVVLNGTSQFLNGNITFNNLTKIVTANDTLSFQPGKTKTITGNLILQGQGNGTLSLRSNTSGQQWFIDAQGARALDPLDVKDGYNLNSQLMVVNNGIDSGNNVGWVFGSTSISFYLDYPGGNSHITNTNPTYRWKKATVSNNSAITKYELYIQPKNLITNASIGTALYIDNILPSIGDNKQYAYYSTYTLHDDGSFLNLLPSSYMLTPGKYNFRVVAHDSAGNVREESVDFYVDAVSNPIYTNTKLTNSLINKSTTSPINQSTNSPINQTPTAEPLSTSTPTPTVVEPIFAWWWILIVLLIIFFLFLIWKRRKRKEEVR